MVSHSNIFAHYPKVYFSYMVVEWHIRFIGLQVASSFDTLFPALLWCYFSCCSFSLRIFDSLPCWVGELFCSGTNDIWGSCTFSQIFPTCRSMSIFPLNCQQKSKVWFYILNGKQIVSEFCSVVTRRYIHHSLAKLQTIYIEMLCAGESCCEFSLRCNIIMRMKMIKNCLN